MIPRRQTLGSVAATLVLVLTAASVAVVTGAGPALASHGAENGNYTVVFPSETPAPGAQGVTVNHFAAATQEQFTEMGAPNHVNMSWIIISSQDIDFSQCSTPDTSAFGIDRGNDDSGTNTDEDLLRHRKDSDFRDNSIVVEFFDDDDDFAPPDSPPTLYPVDEIVAAQDTCYGLPEEAGWYQIHGYMNGTNSNGEHVEVDIPSHYFYVCDCANEQEARNTLGPPPSEQEDGPGTPTPDDGDDVTDPTETATDSDSSTPTPTPSDGDSDTSPDDTTATATAGSGGGNGGGGDGGGNGDGGGAQNTTPQTPVPEQPGFGVLGGLIALVVAALFAIRRNR